MTPERAMRLALDRARRVRGRTWPNPPVGAVVYRGKRVLGGGATRPAGGPHAEIVAIEAARRRHGARALRGASLAVTLEPCSHTGRTGPCSEAVLEAGIRRVDVGHRDPTPHAAGRGLRRLRAAGLEVRTGVLEAECREQHRGFLSVLERGRPFVSLKLAASLDGRIATRRGDSRWISGPAARAWVHRLRAASDAVAVGVGTARADDPALTARRGERIVRSPARVVFDTRLRLPPDARLLTDDAPVFIVCGVRPPAARLRALEAEGARVLPVRTAAGRVHLVTALRRLAREGLTELLVEGGGKLAGSLLRAGLVDELHWVVSPKLVGGDGAAALGPLGVGRLAVAPRLASPRIRRLGEDVSISGRPTTGERG
jgi:diaminohydroxyphosphoribosylaminopyrimidine deaminase/5-amino-6-(5-phosphoribosylamino)uracil reductase